MTALFRGVVMLDLRDQRPLDLSRDMVVCTLSDAVFFKATPIVTTVARRKSVVVY